MSGKRHLELDRLFYPNNIAVVGASPKRGDGWASGNSWISASIKQNFQGTIYPIHPKAENILGLKAYRSISEVPDDIDLAILTVSAPVAVKVMEDCVKKGVKYVHVLAAGFSETGRSENIEMEKELVSLAKQGGINIIGPNCMGLYCPEGGLAWSNEFSSNPGKIGFFSQSGQLAYEFVMTGSIQGLKFSKVVSFGNACGLQPHDFLTYLANDEKTEIIGAYLEGLRNGRDFFEAARNVARKKPLVIWKGGRTKGGSRAIQSHTAAIAGSQDIWKSMFKQAGVISVGSLEELIFSLSALQQIKLPRGPNVAIMGGGGGGGVTMTDVAESEGLNVPQLSEETISSLGEFVPLQGTSIKNPLDVIPVLMSMGRDNYIKLIGLLREDPRIDALIFVLLSGTIRMFGRSGCMLFVDLMIEAGKHLNKPVMVVLERAPTIDVEIIRQEAEMRFQEARITTFPSFHLASRILAYMSKYRDFLSS